MGLLSGTSWGKMSCNDIRCYQKCWKETEIISNYFTRSSILNIHPESPAVLICDGHTSHNGVGLVENGEGEKKYLNCVQSSTQVVFNI